MHIGTSARRSSGGLKTHIFYLLGSGHIQKIMKPNFHHHQSPGGDRQLDQISRNRQMSQL